MKFNQILYSLENNNHSYFVVTFTPLSLRAQSFASKDYDQ